VRCSARPAPPSTPASPAEPAATGLVAFRLPSPVGATEVAAASSPAESDRREGQADLAGIIAALTVQGGEPAIKSHRRRVTELDRHGRWVFLLLFIALFAGRFELAGDAHGTGGIDVRLAPAALALLAYPVWLSIAHRRLQRTSLGGYGLFFTAFVTWMMASAAWALPGARVAETSLDLAVMLLLVMVALDVAGRLTPIAVESIWTWLLVAGIIAIGSAALDGPDLQGRYSAAGGGPNVFVRYMALAALASCFIAMTRDRLWTLWLLPLFGLGALMSGSRGGLVAIAVIALTGCVPLLRRMRSRMRLRLLAASLVGGLVLTYALGERVADFLRYRFLQQTFAERYDSSRLILANLADELIGRYPILGAGMDGFHASYPQWPHPHNLWLAARTDGGLVAAALLALVLTAVAWTLLRCRPLSTSALFYLLGGVLNLVAGMFSGDVYDSRFAWLLFGLAVVELRRERDVVHPDPELPSGAAAGLGVLPTMPALLRD
jgi:O-antigen ligase